jgi:hypothetical protein
MSRALYRLRLKGSHPALTPNSVERNARESLRLRNEYDDANKSCNSQCDQDPKVHASPPYLFELGFR